MSNLYEKIAQLCSLRGITGYRMCKDIGMTPGAITDLKMGRKETLSAKNLDKVAQYFGVSVSYLLGTDENKISPYSDNAVGTFEDVQFVRFPVISTVTAGYTGIAAEVFSDEYEYVIADELSAAPDEYFVLRVSGDSMYPKLLDGDRVLVRRRKMVEDGRIAVVLYNGDEATLKKVRYTPGKCMELIPINPEYQRKYIEGADLEQCQILGEVVKLMRDM